MDKPFVVILSGLVGIYIGVVGLRWAKYISELESVGYSNGMVYCIENPVQCKLQYDYFKLFNKEQKK